VGGGGGRTAADPRRAAAVQGRSSPVKSGGGCEKNSLPPQSLPLRGLREGANSSSKLTAEPSDAEPGTRAAASPIAFGH
jgi:hypothetical protein